MKLQIQDQRLLEAAEGWLGLDNWHEANEELERITPEMRSHPSVLCLRWQIYAKAKQWEGAYEIARAISEMVPDSSFGFIHMAYSLHEMKRTEEAREVLIPIVHKFEDYTLFYNLSCYACRLGKTNEAYEWLKIAIDFAGDEEVRLVALKDPDLEPLWANIGKI